MNKEYTYISKDVYEVTDTNGKTKRRIGLMDTKGVLECENKIEAIDSYIDLQNESIKESDRKIKKSRNVILIAALIYILGMLGVYGYFFSTLEVEMFLKIVALRYTKIVALATLPFLVAGLIPFVSIIIKSKKNKNGCKRVLAKIKELEDEYEREIEYKKNNKVIDMTKFLEEEENKRQHRTIALSSEEKVYDEVVPQLQDAYYNRGASLTRKKK